jgi:hypothetical protein
MENGKQQSPLRPDSWPVRLATAGGMGIAGTLALLVGFLADLHLPLPWSLIAYLAAIGVGGVLGHLAGTRLFPRSPGT